MSSPAHGGRRGVFVGRIRVNTAASLPPAARLLRAPERSRGRGPVRAIGGPASSSRAQVRRVRAVVSAESLSESAYQIALGRRQQRIPDVEYQNDAHVVTVVPSLVVDGVVEHPGLS